MPLYEYNCPKCNRDFEVLVRGEETPKCPHCGNTQLAKQLSVPAAHARSSKTLPICGAPEPGACGTSCCGAAGCPWE